MLCKRLSFGFAAMDHPEFIVCSYTENPIGLKMVKRYYHEPNGLVEQANATIRVSLILYDFYLSTILFIHTSE